MSEAEKAQIHPFERAGLGKSPFRLAGVRDTAEGADGMGLVRVGNIGGFEYATKPGGTCAYCGQYIKILCNIISADGKRFHVGTDCVHKTAQKSLITKVTAAQRAYARKQRIARAAAKSNELSMIVADEQARVCLQSHPHPSAFRASKGETLLDWATWMSTHGGAAGRARALKSIKLAIAKGVRSP